jgi:7-cyano-7-deazaguanine synthase in queuosine biosynthesis
MITLVMLSGGLDSAYVLAKLLRETDDDVIAHHIHLITNAGRHEPEAISCQKIIDYCQKEFRPFVYTVSTIDRRGFLFHGRDIISAAFEAGALAGSHKLATGKRLDRWTIGISLADNVEPNRFKQADSACRMNCPPDTSPEFFLLDRVSQQKIISYLPYKLYKMAWSCRFAKKDSKGEFSPCGECNSCKRLEGFMHPEEPA